MLSNAEHDAECTGSGRSPVGVVMLLRWGGIGGTQRQALTLSRELCALGATVFVLIGRGRELPGHAPEPGVSVHHVGFPARGSLYALSFLLGSLFWMLRHRRDFDVVHACNLPTGFTAALVAPLLGKPLIVKLPNARIIGEFAARPFGRLRWRVLRRAVDRFLALTAEVEQALAAVGVPPDRIVCMPNGVADEGDRDIAAKARALRTTLGLSCDQGIVVFVGSLIPVKAVDWLLEAWPAVRARHEGSRLLIVGDGSDREKLQALARSLGIAESVDFLGEWHDVDALLAAATVFVLPSRSEGMSNALLEAMSHGVPPIASDIPANRAVIDHGRDGRLVPFGDREALANSILELLLDPASCRRLGGEARRTITRRFALPRVAARHYDLYRELVASDGACPA